MFVAARHCGQREMIAVGEGARRKLALLVIRHMERVERNPVSPAAVALIDLLR